MPTVMSHLLQRQLCSIESLKWSNQQFIRIFILTVAIYTFTQLMGTNKSCFKHGADDMATKILLAPDVRASQNFVQNYFRNNESPLASHWLNLIKHYIHLPLDRGFGSHKLALLAVSLLTGDDGPVMELGCGHHSTVLLHQIVVQDQKRYLLSTDTDFEWLSKFQTNMSTPLHRFRHIKKISEWNTVGTDRSYWSFAFIDHKPGERRVVDLIRLANVTNVVVLHDTETASYQYDQGLAEYPYRYRYMYLSTHTDVISKTNATLINKIRYLLDLTLEWKLPILND